MIQCETIVVGGGPAGSAAAWQLHKLGKECLILDRQTFPREKLCAGWITPEVLSDLQIEPADYPHGLMTFDKLKASFWRLPFSLTTTQYSIRRIEFDQWLLARSCADVAVHTVRQVKRVPDGFEIDGKYSCENLIGAGGTGCPVYRSLFRSDYARDKTLQAFALELEYPCSWQDADCHLCFACNGLPGYAWYVPKANGYLNIGVGGMAHPLKFKNDTIHRHWDLLIKRLVAQGLIDELPGQPRGYSYYLRGQSNPAWARNLHLIGDARGLATRDLCEGIGPAVRSGLQAARAIAGDNVSQAIDGDAFSLTHKFPQRALEWQFLRTHLAA